jgi:ATP-dependent Lon protease
MKLNNWIPTDDSDEINMFLHQRTEEINLIPDQEEDENGEITSPIIWLKDVIIFPHMVTPLLLSSEDNLASIEKARETSQTVIGVVKSDLEDKDDEDGELLIGVEVAVGRLLDLSEGTNTALAQGRFRTVILDIYPDEDGVYWAKAKRIIEPDDVNRETDALMRSVKDSFGKCVQLNRNLPDEAYLYALNIEEPGWLADLIATALTIPFDDRMKLFKDINVLSRLQHVHSILVNEIDVLELETEIQDRVQREVDRSQREYYLREQMRAIQSELGETDILIGDVASLHEQIAQANLPPQVEEVAVKELNRLTQMSSMAPEVTIVRTYLDWLLELPWSKSTEDHLDINHVSEILDEYHYGLTKIKDRILEYIAVKSLKPKQDKQPILCFVGPPGTGKTSLGRSIAEALGREFVRVSLGGVRDEAEIRGHRRTYIGAMPGRIVKMMRKAGTNNPLMMLDEIDKMSNDFRGDPASALLEVLDPEQNENFSDHYLEIPMDLSKVFFIATANSYGNIPPALLDRVEVIEFSSYLEEEKLEISRKFLIKRQIEQNGLEPDEIRFTEDALLSIIRDYTLEAGVRNLEREIGKICRRIARKKTEGKRYPKRITVDQIEAILGPQQFFGPDDLETNEVGVATGIAWTENGGEVMPVEVMILDGKGNLQITGQIGDVMQESAQAALSYIKGKAKLYGIDPEGFENMDIHIHVPEGAIPKDGPSAGVTIATALLSALSGKAVDRFVAMTGEITLRGRVLPVGGLKEKILAAHRFGRKKVIIPGRNVKDLVELPKGLAQKIEIIPVTELSEVFKISILEIKK